MTSFSGSAVVDGNIAYFSRGREVYKVHENKWTELVPCTYDNFGMAVINHVLTSIGGSYKTLFSKSANTNVLLSFHETKTWKQVYPPMPTKRMKPATATIAHHLIVAGGKQDQFEGLGIVEVMDTDNRQWFTASSLPTAVRDPQMTVCGGLIYLSDNKSMVFSATMESLLGTLSTSRPVWCNIKGIPVQSGSTLATLRGHVAAIGGKNEETRTNTIQCYNEATHSWSVVDEMPIPKFDTLVAVLPNELLIVGGSSKRYTGCTVHIGKLY